MTVLRLAVVVLVAFVFSVPAGMPSQAEAILIGSQGTAASTDGVESNAPTTQTPGSFGVLAAPIGVNLANPTLAIAPNPFWVAPEPGTTYVSHMAGSGTQANVPNGTVIDFREIFTVA